MPRAFVLNTRDNVPSVVLSAHCPFFFSDARRPAKSFAIDLMQVHPAC